MNFILKLIFSIAAIRANREARRMLDREDAILGERLQRHRQARLARRQRAAKHTLGADGIAHPEYRFNPRHSNNTAIYPHFRQHYLDTIRDAAELARSDNPAHCRHAARLARLY